jgi:hypothetical protein
MQLTALDDCYSCTRNTVTLHAVVDRKTLGHSTDNAHSTDEGVFYRLLVFLG